MKDRQEPVPGVPCEERGRRPRAARAACAQVALLVRDRAERARFISALRGTAEVIFCERGVELLRLAQFGKITAVLTELSDRDGEATLPFVLQLARGYPSIPILVYTALDAPSCHALVDYVSCGTSEIVLRGHDDRTLALRRALDSAAVRRAVLRVMDALSARVGAHGATIVEHCLRNAGRSQRVGQIAAALSCPRRTLAHRLAAEELPPPRALIAWCRLLVAAQLLEDPARSIDHVALALDFGSGTALRNMLRYHTGLRPGDVRRRGGLLCVLELFMAALGQPSAALAIDLPGLRGTASNETGSAGDGRSFQP